MDRAGTILSAIFDSIDDVWFFVLPDYSIKFYNKKAFNNCKVFHGKELKSGDNILDYARDTQNKVDEKFLKSFELASQGKILKNEEYIEYDSTTIWTRSKYTPVYENNHLLGISIIVEDITTQKELEQERVKHQEEILELSNKREEFINIASHELKTPLTSLKASLQFMSKLIDKESGISSIKTFLEKSNQSVDKLHNLIKSLLDSNKITSGALALDKSAFIIAELIDLCCYHIRMDGKHHISIQGDKTLAIYADKEKVDQVVINLVNNAVKYAPQSKEIIIKIEKLNSEAKISITDFGPGIPPEKISNLFKRYFQAGNDHNHYSGMGLGLYIAEGIIKQHGGKIGVTTKLNHGSTFWFTLPL